jgi:DNA-binding NarL/FixJ family response regulator
VHQFPQARKSKDVSPWIADSGFVGTASLLGNAQQRLERHVKRLDEIAENCADSGAAQSLRVVAADMKSLGQFQMADLIANAIKEAVLRVMSGLPRADTSQNKWERLSGSKAHQDQSADNGIERRLTPRQREVLFILGDGNSNAEIAAILNCAPNTVKLHIAAIVRRLGLKNRTQAVLLAAKLRRGDKVAVNSI